MLLLPVPPFQNLHDFVDTNTTFFRCQDNKTTMGERYLRRCDSELHAHAMLLDAMADSGVRGPESLTMCDQDGSYTSKQCDQEM